jgi:hypothetical protein
MVHGNLAAVEATQNVSFNAAGVKVFRRDHASSYGWWGNLAIVIGRQPPEAAHVMNYRACVLELHKQFPQGVGLITIVNDTSTPSASGREAMIQMFKEVWPLMTAALFVPNATGFKAAVMRSIIGCFILATGQRDRVHVEASAHEGLPWLLNKVLGVPEARRQLQRIEAGVTHFWETESAYTPVVDSVR